MKRYLIALDMDGTLLNDKGEISDTTAEYLKHLNELGHIVVIASGRPIRSIIKYYHQLGLTSPVICYNGASILSPNDKTFVERNFSFPNKVIKEIYNDVGSNHIDNVMCETNKDIWLIREDETLKDFFWHDGMNVIYGELEKILHENPMTMIIKSHSTESDHLVVKAVSRHPGIKVRFWNGMYELFSEIYYEHISKAEGLKYIADFYNIPHDQTIAFGDACNDIEMLQFAGIGVAMINGDDTIKKYAKRITRLDNNHDGIIDVLKDIIQE